MRWSLRRGAKGLGADRTAPAPPAAATASERGWSSLPPLAPSWSARPPLTVEPRPAAALLTDRRRPRSTPSATDGTPEPGRVVGLGTVVVPPPATPPAVIEPPSYFIDQPPLRHATARPITEHAPLTAATADYVGEPVAPHAAPTPPPRPIAPAEPPVEAASEAGARFREALANLHRRGAPDGLPGQRSMITPDSPPPAEATRPAPAAAPPPPASDEPRPAVPGVAPRDPFAAGPPPAPMTHRRNSLAQSRRLGLGAPVQREAEDAAPEPAPSSPPSDIAEALEATRAAAEAAIEAATADAAAAVAQAEADAAAARAEAASATAPPAPAEHRPAAADPTEVRPPLTTTPTVRPISDGSSRPALSVAPLRFRAAPRPIEAAAEPPRAPERAVVTRPPAELAQALRSTHGVEVADVEIRRDSAVTAEASQRRARAFTRGATVHLPEAAGPLTSPAARGLLAHELVHAAQQRRLGSALPGENTPEGRALEAEALDAERAHGGTPPSITSSEPLRHAPPPVSSAWVEDRITQHALPFEIPQHRPDEYLTPQQRDQVRWEASEIAKDVLGSAGSASGGGSGGGVGSPGTGSGSIGGATGSGGSNAADATDPDAPPDIGDMHATNVTEYIESIRGRYNLSRRQVGLPDIPSFPPDQVAEMEKEFNELVAHQKSEREAARKLKDDREDRAAKEKERLAERTKQRQEQREARDKAHADARKDLPKPGDSWTPGGGMQRGGAAALAGGAAAGVAGAAALGGGGGQSEIYKAEDALEDSQDKLDDAQAALAAVTSANDDALSSFKATNADDFVASLQASYNFQRRLVGLPEQKLSAEEEKDAREQFAVLKKTHDDEVLKKRQKDAQAAVDRAQKSRDEAAKKVDATKRRIAERAAVGTTVAGAAAPAAGTVATTTSTPSEVVSADHATEVMHGDSSHQTHDTANIEALAERIYDRLRSRLRTELLIDRERAGLLTDFR